MNLQDYNINQGVDNNTMYEYQFINNQLSQLYAQINQIVPNLNYYQQQYEQTNYYISELNYKLQNINGKQICPIIK